MKRILISTNYHSLNRVIGERNNELSINLIDQHSMVYFNNSHEFQVDDCNAEIILILDSLTQFPDAFSFVKEDDYFIHHRTEHLTHHFKDKQIIKGMHESYDDVYPKAFEIIFDNTKKNKAEEIISALFGTKKLEAIERLKTDFLYHIYNGGTPSSFSKFSEIPQIQSHENLFDEFNQEDKLYKKDWDFDEDETKGKDQRTNLSLLRDALLANN